MKLIVIIIGLISFIDCFSQDSVVYRNVKRDSKTVRIIVTYADIDLEIRGADKELDSLYSIYKIKYPTLTNNLSTHSKRIKDYVGELINNKNLRREVYLTSTDSIYEFKFRNSSLSQELEKYIKSFEDVNLNTTVKKIASRKVQKIKKIELVNKFTHKYNASVTILKMQLLEVIRSEIYMLDNADIVKEE